MPGPHQACLPQHVIVLCYSSRGRELVRCVARSMGGVAAGKGEGKRTWGIRAGLAARPPWPVPAEWTGGGDWATFLVAAGAWSAKLMATAWSLAPEATGEDDEEGGHGESGVPAPREGDPDDGEQPHEDVELDDAGELLREVVADEGRKVEVRSHLQQHARNAERVASQCVWYASHGGSTGPGQNAQTLLNPEFFRMQGWRWRL